MSFRDEYLAELSSAREAQLERFQEYFRDIATTQLVDNNNLTGSVSFSRNNMRDDNINVDAFKMWVCREGFEITSDSPIMFMVQVEEPNGSRD